MTHQSPEDDSKPLNPPQQPSAMRRGPLARGAKLLGIPLGSAGRAAVGAGRRLLGDEPEAVQAQVREQNAQQLFAVLGDLKGGAMKVGQALSLLEACLPEEEGAPYRRELRRLQAAAPPMPAAQVHGVLAAEFGPGWRERFVSFQDRPAAAASIGQVHRAVWAATGEDVAVKVQYPGAADALRSDLKTMSRLSSVASPWAAGLDLRSLTAEISARIIEEVNYDREAENQTRAAEAFAGDAEIQVPSVLAHTPRVIISQWVSGRPFAEAEELPLDERNLLGLRYARFLFRGPAVAGLLHADPHPGNFLILPDRRLAVLDWGLAASLPDGLPVQMGLLLRRAQQRDAAAMTAGLRAEGFLTHEIPEDTLLDYLLPFVEPAATPTFHFNRDWMRRQYARVAKDPHNKQVLNSLNLPAEYMLLHRVWLGGVAVLSQLDCTAPFAAILDEFLPGWT